MSSDETAAIITVFELATHCAMTTYVHALDPLSRLSRSTLFALVLALVVAFVFCVSTFLYLVVSFWQMRSHSEPRAFRNVLRDAWLELQVILKTQPFFLLYYLKGHLFGEGEGRPVIFVHGYFQNRIDFLYLAKEMRAAGFGPLYGFNYPWFLSVRANAKRLSAFIQRVCEERKCDAVDLVCHSLGGLVAVEVLQHEAPRVHACVTIASPHGGIAYRGPIVGKSGRDLRATSKLVAAHAQTKLGVPFLSIYSSHDNVVFPARSSSLVARGGRDHMVGEMPHLAILFSPEVSKETIRFLRDPQASEIAVVDVS